MDDLVAWLRGVLEEDERLAQSDAEFFGRPSASSDDLALAREAEWRLADVEAKRAILDARHSDALQSAATTLTDAGWDEVPADALDATWAYLVRLLASAYRDRPGYRDEWRP